MKKIFIILPFIIIGIALWIYFGREIPPQNLNLISPNQKYRIELNENVDLHKNPYPFDLLEFRQFNKVNFSAYKDNEQLASSQNLWEDSSSDMRFFDVYKPQWINDSVVKFGYDKTMPKDKMDELEVLNNSSQPTGYLLINAKERFLILDLQPKEKVKFSIFPQSWLSWISCKGNFENNQTRFYRGVNFSIHDNAETHIPKHYFITIKDDEVLIQSSEIDGYTDQNGVEVKIPKYQESQ